MAETILEHELEQVLAPCLIHEACLRIVGRMPEGIDPPKRKEVTDQDIQEMQRLRSEGLYLKDIGARLGFDASTVKRHTKGIMKPRKITVTEAREMNAMRWEQGCKLADIAGLFKCSLATVQHHTGRR